MKAQDGVAVRSDGISKSFGAIKALNNLTTEIKRGRLTGVVGPDGAGKTTLMRMMAGLLTPTSGRLMVAGLDIIHQAEDVHTVVGYMPQRFGLYEDLSVIENMRLYAGLRGLVVDKQQTLFNRLLDFTRLSPFKERLAGRLSGGMKQKLGLACALMGQPEVLLLDEPGVGVDPVSRQDLWRMVGELTTDGMAVVWSTAYLDEAERCEDVLLLQAGELIYSGIPAQLTQRLHQRSFRLTAPSGDRRGWLKQALDLPDVCDGVIQGEGLRIVLRASGQRAALEKLAQQAGSEVQDVPPRFEDAFVDLLGGGSGGTSVLAEHFAQVPAFPGFTVSCNGLTRRFGSFVATDRVDFQIQQGEIFGLLGPNGAGKSTTFRMLCGLLKPTEGETCVMGFDLARATGEAKRQLGYMAQKFSLYGLLSVQQNLEFSSGVYGLTGNLRRERIEEMISIFELESYLSMTPDSLPFGVKQRLALACALMHRPPVLFLDEPTSGVDPLTRREFWTHINGLVHKGVTILVTTHFMEEAEYCDRVALMVQGKVIALDKPDGLKRSVADETLPDPTMEQAFIRLIERANAQSRAT